MSEPKKRTVLVDLAKLDERFEALLAPHVGETVDVWTTRLDRPYRRGELFRVYADRLILAFPATRGFAEVAFAEIDKVVAASGVEYRYVVIEGEAT